MTRRRLRPRRLAAKVGRAGGAHRATPGKEIEIPFRRRPDASREWFSGSCRPCGPSAGRARTSDALDALPIHRPPAGRSTPCMADPLDDASYLLAPFVPDLSGTGRQGPPVAGSIGPPLHPLPPRQARKALRPSPATEPGGIVRAVSMRARSRGLGKGRVLIGLGFLARARTTRRGEADTDILPPPRGRARREATGWGRQGKAAQV